MKVITTDGATVETTKAEKFKELEGDELRAAMDADVADRNKRAEELGIKTRYMVDDAA